MVWTTSRLAGTGGALDTAVRTVGGASNEEETRRLPGLCAGSAQSDVSCGVGEPLLVLTVPPYTKIS